MKWLMQYSHSFHFGWFCMLSISAIILGIAASFRRPDAELVGSVSGGVASAVTLLSAVPGLLTLRYATSARCHELVIVLCAAFITSAWTAGTFLVSDNALRRQANVTTQAVLKVIFPAFGCRLKATILLILWSTAMDIVVINVAAPAYYGIETDAMQIYQAIAFLPLFLLFAWLHNSRFLQLYTAQEELSGEAYALKGLLSVTCDCSIWVVGDDARIVVRESCKPFDMLIQQSMRGKSFLETCFLESQEERDRVQDAFKRATNGCPVVLPTTLNPRVGSGLQAEMLISHRPGLHEVSTLFAHEVDSCGLVGSCSVYLVGFRMKAELPLPERKEDESPVRPSMILENPEPDAAPAEDEAEAILTSRTGQIFTVAAAKGSTADDMMQVLELGREEHWLIRPEELQLDLNRILGQGSFGAVVAASFRGSPAAVKVPRKRADVANGVVRRALPLLPELRMLRMLRHPNIVLFHGACVDVETRDVALVFEEIKGETLRSFVLRGKLHALEQPERSVQKLQLLLDCARGLRYLHEQTPPLVHGDLKDGNIFVEMWAGGPRAKLGDFGLTRQVKASQQMSCGTLRWAAPEVICMGWLRVEPTTSSDVFSFGRLIHFLVVEKRPLESLGETELRRMAQYKGRMPTITWPRGEVPDSIRHLGRWCMRFKESERPKIDLAQSLLEEELPSLSAQKVGGSVGGSDASSSSRQEKGGMNRGPPRPWGQQLEYVRALLGDGKPAKPSNSSKKGLHPASRSNSPMSGSSFIGPPLPFPLAAFEGGASSCPLGPGHSQSRSNSSQSDSGQQSQSSQEDPEREPSLRYGQNAVLQSLGSNGSIDHGSIDKL